MLRLEDFAIKQRCKYYEVIENALSGMTSMPIIITTKGEITVYEINNEEASKLIDADVIPLQFEICEINKVFLKLLKHESFPFVINAFRQYRNNKRGHFYEFNNVPLIPPALHSYKHNENVNFAFTKEVKINIENIWMPSINEEVSTEDRIRKDDELKIPCKIGLFKIKKIFLDLEQQGFVKEGTTSKLEDHFTESAMKEKIPNQVSPIEWIATLYELRSLIRSLRSSDSIEGDLSSVARHFLFRGKIVTRSQLESGAIGTEKLDRLENLLSRHDIHCVP